MGGGASHDNLDMANMKAEYEKMKEAGETDEVIFDKMKTLVGATAATDDVKADPTEETKTEVVETVRRIVFIGPPLCGKGTQSKILSDKLSFKHISTGDLLRKAIAEETEEGKAAKEAMDKGELVADELVCKLVSIEIGKIEGSLILDGFPRNVSQAKNLNDLLVSLNKPITIAINFDVAEDLLMKRMTGRLCALQSGRTYNKFFNPPKVEGKCDETGEDLIQRDDDSEEVFHKRMASYRDDTMPILEYYKDVLSTIDANKDFQEVTDQVEALFK